MGDMETRVSNLERSVADLRVGMAQVHLVRDQVVDHEARIRLLERFATKVGVFGFIGAGIGGVVTSLVVKWLAI